MQTSLPVLIVEEGKFDGHNVELSKRDEEYFLGVLKDHGCDELKKVLVLTVDGKGKAYLQFKGEKYQVFELNWEETLW